MRWDEIKVGDIVRVPKGTRRGSVMFKVREVIQDPYRADSTIIRGLEISPLHSWTYFIKSNNFTGFSVKGEAEFVNGEDE